MSDTFTAILTLPNEFARDSFRRAMDHAAAMLKSGENVLVSVGPSLEVVGVQQRKFLHGVVLKQISEQVVVEGVRYTIDIWKEHYRKRFVGANGWRWVSMAIPRWDAELGRMVQPKNPTPRRVRVSTEELGVRDYAKFTNEVIDHAVVELGVEFVFTNEERELVARKPEKKSA